MLVGFGSGITGVWGVDWRRPGGRSVFTSPKSLASQMLIVRIAGLARLSWAKHGSIAVIERFIKTLKDEGTRRLLVPLESRSARRELLFILEWYNVHRPHMTLAGKTPNEVFFCRDFPANGRPRVEPRAQWPRGSPCSQPQVPIEGKPGDRFHLDLSYHQDRAHLPIVTLRRAS